YPIHADGRVVGTVASGTQSPSLNVGIGLGYVPAALAVPGTALQIDIRGRLCPAEVVRKPIFRKA
ncbi:MAG: glycine cleavage T C-terminal barrel domain-containing protein, partial [Burkholderiaceae bacterium]|nr:glycine cleavage T C-terminal barrel domain-containing protein [Burkholderiaceae bacterium]